MTVGIAAICDNGDAIVMAADRRVTYERTASLEYESEHAKILQISEHALTAITGGLTDADAAEEMLASAISLPDLTNIKEIAIGLRRCCSDIRSEQLEGLTKKLTGLSLADFQKKLLEHPLSQITLEIYSAIKQDQGLTFLLAGFDNRSRIYTVNEYTIASHHNPGFASVGSGGVQATLELARCGQSVRLSLPETMYCVFAAKRAAESATGVGTTTNMAVIRRDMKPAYLQDEQLEPLQAAHDKYSRPSLTDKDIANIDGVIPEGQSIEPPQIRVTRKSSKARQTNR